MHTTLTPRAPGPRVRPRAALLSSTCRPRLALRPPPGRLVMFSPSASSAGAENAWKWTEEGDQPSGNGVDTDRAAARSASTGELALADLLPEERETRPGVGGVSG